MLIVATFLAGCEAGSEPLVEVRGKVTYKSAALPGGTIVFTPDASRGNRGSMAQAEIQSDGTYALRTGPAQGVAPGWYRVTVAAVRPPIDPPPGHRYAVPISLLPEKYRDPDLSGLSCEIKANQPNTINFELE